MDRGQSEVLIPMAREVLAEAGADFPSIDVFGVTTGPGAFTGLRIGLAAARGMALASGRPLVGVSTFEAVAHGVPAEELEGRRSVLVAVESRREDIFVQSFDSKLIPIDEARSVRPEDLVLPDTPVLVAGDGAARLRSLFDAPGNAGIRERTAMCGSPPEQAFPTRRMWRGWSLCAARMPPERHPRSPSTCVRPMSRCQRRKCDDAAPGESRRLRNP